MPSITQKHPQDPGSRLVRTLPVTAGTFAVLGGAISLLGWVAGIPRFIDWDGNGIAIKFNAAICIISAGIALLISAFFPERKTPIRVFGCVAAVIAAATLFQHLTGIDLRIDTLFFDEVPNASAATTPGRMGPPASISLLILGLALILATFRRARSMAAALGLGALFVATLPLIGYLFGANQLYSLPRATSVAFQTALMLFVLAFGVVALIKDKGIAAALLQNDAGGVMFRSLLLPLTGVSLALGFTRVFLQEEGYVDTAFGTAIRTLVEICLLLGLMWWTAERLSRLDARSRDALKVFAENETLRRISEAQEAERKRIARDLHDHIGQQLTALRLKLGALQKKTVTNQELADEIARVSEQTKKLDSDISLLVWQMRPGVLDSHGLASALNSLVREWSINHGINAELHATSSDRRLPPEIETNLYRIIQEALNNIVKHAYAKNVSITLNYLEDEAVLVIEDDGIGFDPDTSRVHEAGGFGLVGMKERAAIVGGRLEIESKAGKGTTILVRVPRLGSTQAAAARAAH